jgi:hypothetical protein
MVLGVLSSKDAPAEVHCSAGIRAEGTRVIDPWLPGIRKRTTTVEVVPWGTVTGAATTQVGPSPPLTARGPAPVTVISEAAAGRLAAISPR